MAQAAAMALEDAIVLAKSLTSADSIAAALTAFERRRRPRTDWVRAQTRRRDRTRNLPPTIRSLMLSGFGERILRSNYQPLRESPDPLEVPVRLLCLVALSLALQSSAKRLGGKSFPALLFSFPR
jgi:2-polyprenyl-6-methoxyphenol hydroxylase-like FAD-dependent oxidoreductase